MSVLVRLGRLDRRAEAAMDAVASRLVSGAADVHRGRLYGFGLRRETIPVSTPAGRSARSSAAFLKTTGGKLRMDVVAALQPLRDALDRAARSLAQTPLGAAVMEAERMRVEREGRGSR